MVTGCEGFGVRGLVAGRGGNGTGVLVASVWTALANQQRVGWRKVPRRAALATG